MRASLSSQRLIDGVTPIFKAASKGFKHIVDLLLKKKPDLGVQQVSDMCIVHRLSDITACR